MKLLLKYYLTVYNSCMYHKSIMKENTSKYDVINWGDDII